jgi:endoglucanase
MPRKLLFILALLSACTLSISAQSAVSDDPFRDGQWLQDGSPHQDVGVEGTHLTLNGRPWHARGVALQGFVRPLAMLQSELAAHPDDQEAKNLLIARHSYGWVELEFARAFHANTLRFQVSQPALDPESPIYDSSYLDQITDAIRKARVAGFVVMIMMQDEKITGDAGQSPLPTEQTRRDWELLTRAFGSDRGIIFELYNEPDLLASTENWNLWLNGGELDSKNYVGMQMLVNDVRTNGGQNVLVLDGLAVDVISPSTGKPVHEAAESLAGVRPPEDPLNRVVYAVHPYQHGLAIEDRWEEDFGATSMTLPVWADEWSAPTGLALGLGTLHSYRVAVDLLNFLRDHSIPLCTGAIDVPQWVVEQVPGWRLTSYRDYSDTSKNEGSGTLVYHDYADDYSRPLTMADGLEP